MSEAIRSHGESHEWQCSDWGFSFSARSSPAEWPQEKEITVLMLRVHFLPTRLLLNTSRALASQDPPFSCPVFRAEEI